MRDNRLQRIKREDIYRTYKTGLENGCFSSFREAAKWVSQQPAPRYYISERTASLLIGKMMRGEEPTNLRASSRRMLCQLYSDFTNYINTHPQCDLTRERKRILSDLVERPAPEFYTDAAGIRKIIRSENRRVRSTWENAK